MEWSPKDSAVQFSKLERLAIVVLLVIIVLGATSAYWLPAIWSRPVQDQTLDRVAFRAEVTAWEKRNQQLVDSLARAKSARDQRYADNRAAWSKPRWNNKPDRRKWPKSKAKTVAIDYSIPLPELESVDANTIGVDVLLRMGVPSKVAKTWVKFRDRGGSFVRKEDVGKIYGMPDSTLKRILPYLKKPDLKAKAKPKAEKSIPVVVNVNVASSEELQKVRGIGPFFAERIVDYRAKLGGFISIEQLAETPGFRDSTYLKLRDKLTFIAQEPRRIRINQVSQRLLAEHPYISYKQAEVVILNRRNHGDYASKQDLLETVVLDEATVDRLMPYIDFGD